MASRFKWREMNDTADEKAVGKYAATENDEPSLTQQQFTADADLNEVMRRYGVTDRAIPPQAFPNGVPTVDLTEFSGMELRDAMDQIREAQTAFGNLPAELRTHFGNDPVRLWNFVNNPANAEKAVEMGLLSTTAKPEPVVTAQASATGTAPPANGAPPSEKK